MPSFNDAPRDCTVASVAATEPPHRSAEHYDEGTYLSITIQYCLDPRGIFAVDVAAGEKLTQTDVCVFNSHVFS